MKTFQEFFDGLSPKAQDILEYNCKWVDRNSPDRYSHKDEFNTIDEFITKYKDKYKPSDFAILFLLKMINANKQQIDDFCEITRTRLSSCTASCFSIDQRKELYSQYKGELNFYNWLFIQNDYENLSLDKLDVKDVSDNELHFEVLGYENMKAICRENPRILKLDTASRNQETANKIDQLIDELFFGENGWTEKQRIEFLNNQSRYRCDLTDVDIFMKKIGCVGKKYLKYVYQYISASPWLAQQLYDLKKNDSEINPQDDKDMTYRYPKWLRKLFIIMGCCARKNVSKVNAAKLQKEGIALLKLYNYDFDLYYNAMYPETIEKEESSEQNVNIL